MLHLVEFAILSQWHSMSMIKMVTQRILCTKKCSEYIVPYICNYVKVSDKNFSGKF